VDTSISNQHAASIFKVGMYGLRNWLGHIDRLKGKWSFIPTGGVRKWSPVLANRSSEHENAMKTLKFIYTEIHCCRNIEENKLSFPPTFKIHFFSLQMAINFAVCLIQECSVEKSNS
jgi:hypothetical protein